MDRSNGTCLCFRHPRFWLACGVVLLVIALRGAELFAAVPTASEVLDKLRARRESVRNVRVEVVWQEYENGRPSRWSEDRISRDDLGRIRITCYHGSGVIGKGPRKLTNELYNGETTVEELRDPTKDRFGKPRQPPGHRDSNECFWVAIINDGQWPPRGGLASHRDPLTFIDQSVIQDLSKLLADGRSVVVKPTSKRKNLYEIDYKLDSKDDPDSLTHQCLIDADKGWVVTRHEQLFPNGKSARLAVCEYTKDNKSGLWLPAKGRLLNLWGKNVPDIDWRFTVRGCVINDPGFDERVFNIALAKGVYVTDNRYKVSYTVGEDVVSGNDLIRLAQLAREAEKARHTPSGISNDSRSGLRRFLWTLAGACALALIILVVPTIRRKIFKRASS